MTNYSDTDLQEIAKINEASHLGLLTNCGIYNDLARQIIGMTDAALIAAIAQFAPQTNLSPIQAGLMAAARREVAIRGAK